MPFGDGVMERVAGGPTGGVDRNVDRVAASHTRTPLLELVLVRAQTCGSRSCTGRPCGRGGPLECRDQQLLDQARRRCRCPSRATGTPAWRFSTLVLRVTALLRPPTRGRRRCYGHCRRFVEVTDSGDTSSLRYRLGLAVGRSAPFRPGGVGSFDSGRHGLAACRDHRRGQLHARRRPNSRSGRSGCSSGAKRMQLCLLEPGAERRVEAVVRIELAHVVVRSRPGSAPGSSGRRCRGTPERLRGLVLLVGWEVAGPQHGAGAALHRGRTRSAGAWRPPPCVGRSAGDPALVGEAILLADLEIDDGRSSAAPAARPTAGRAPFVLASPSAGDEHVHQVVVGRRGLGLRSADERLHDSAKSMSSAGSRRRRRRSTRRGRAPPPASR